MKIHVSYDINLRLNPYKGLYIAVEGIDGCGKTTQIEALKNYFKSKKKNVVVTSEPRKEGGIVGELIHKVLKGKIKIPSSSLQYLYTADRIINHVLIVEPALKVGKVVLSHRCLWSNLPYGMLDKGIVDYSSNDARVIDVAHGLLSLYHQFIVPNITFYLRVSINTALKRLSKMKKVKEIYEKGEFLQKIAQGYEWEIKRFPKEFVVIDGERAEREVTDKIISKIKTL